MQDATEERRCHGCEGRTPPGLPNRVSHKKHKEHKFHGFTRKQRSELADTFVDYLTAALPARAYAVKPNK